MRKRSVRRIWPPLLADLRGQSQKTGLLSRRIARLAHGVGRDGGFDRDAGRSGTGFSRSPGGRGVV